MDGGLLLRTKPANCEWKNKYWMNVVRNEVWKLFDQISKNNLMDEA